MLRTELLYLYKNKFVGEIPEEIGNLRNLEKLRLYANPSMFGTIPESIGNLVELQDLELDTMGLVGTIPDSVENLSKLRTFRAFENELSGTIPFEIRKLQNLGTKLRNLHPIFFLLFLKITDIYVFLLSQSLLNCTTIASEEISLISLRV